MIDHIATAQAVADDMGSKLEPTDALAVCVYLLAIVASRQGLSIGKLADAMEIADRALRANAEIGGRS